MNSSQINIIPTLYRSGQTVFRLKDIALFTGQTDFKSLTKRIHYQVKKGELINLRKGIYALHDYAKPELASKVFSPSYLSTDYVLQKEGVIFNTILHLPQLAIYQDQLNWKAQHFSLER